MLSLVPTVNQEICMIRQFLRSTPSEEPTGEVQVPLRYVDEQVSLKPDPAEEGRERIQVFHCEDR